MRLLNFGLTNICQHVSRSIYLEEGLTGLIGPNGSGKSNLIAAIYFALTGDTSRFRHSKRENVISQYAGPDARCGVHVEFTHNGHYISISRDINPVRRILQINSEPAIYGDKEITERLEGLFGVSMKVLGQYVFVDQWEMFSLFKAGPAERSKELYRLFGIEKAEECYAILGDKLNSLEITPPSIDIDTVRSRVLASRMRVRDTESRIATIDCQLPKDYDPYHDPSNVTIDNWNTQQQLDIRIRQQNVALKAAAEVHGALAQSVAEWNTTIAQLERTLRNNRAECEQAKHDIGVWSVYQQQTQNREAIQTKLDQLKGLSAQLLEPTPPPVTFDEVVYRNIETELLTAVRYLEKIGDVDICPTCEETSQRFGSRRIAYKETCDRLVPLYATLCDQKTQHQAFVKEHDQYKRKQEYYHSNIDILEEQLAGFLQTVKPSKSIDDLNKTISDGALLEKRLKVARASHQEASAKLAKSSDNVSRLSDSLTTFIEKRKKYNITQDQYEETKAKIETNFMAHKEREKAMMEVFVARQAINDDEAAIDESLALTQKNTKVLALKSELTSVRQILHRNALPKDIAQSHLDQIEADINQLLNDFGVDFRVKSEEDLKLVIEFNDNRRIPVEALSGGELVVFSLAWRIAVGSRFVSDIGLLCLDEPTAGLDRGRLGCLKTAIEKLRVMSKSRGLQCIIITHESELEPLFDDVIELKTPTVKRNE